MNDRFSVPAGVLLSLVLSLACGDEFADPPGDLRRTPELLTYAWVGAQWFDGRGFSVRTMYTRDGRLTDTRPAEIDSTIDLEGGFVVPAHGEAHQHNVEDNGNLDAFVQGYLSRGVFYVRNPDVLPASRRGIEDRVNLPGSVDVVFANGGFTSPGGHPAGVAQRNIDRGVWTEADGDGQFYWAVDSEDELRSRWPEFLAQGPDFVKAYLLYSEEQARRAGSDDYRFWRGLDPALLPVLVELAHGEDLEVVVHVESAADFRTAVESGADQVAHVPGFRRGAGPDPVASEEETYLVTDAAVELAADRGVVVATTLGDRADGSIGRANLRTLRDAGVTLVVGTDSYEADPVSEIRALERSGVFSNLELLRLWSVHTPRSIFPDRQVGSVAPGAEASFLVLDGNPLEDPAFLFDIRLRVKDGRPLR